MQEWIPPHGRGRIWTLFSTANVTMVSPMVGARIPPELHSQLLEVAARLQVTPSEVLVAALRQYLERLQTVDNSLTAAGILDRLERLERRVEALEAARHRRVVPSSRQRCGATAGRRPHVAEQQRPAAPPADLEALPVMELRRLARTVIGPGGDRDPSTGKHLRRAELLTALRRELGSVPAEGSQESNPAKPPEYSS